MTYLEAVVHNILVPQIDILYDTPEGNGTCFDVSNEVNLCQKCDQRSQILTRSDLRPLSELHFLVTGTSTLCT